MSNQEFLAQFEELKMSVASGFASVNNRFDTIEKRLDTMDNRFDTIEKRLDTLENGVDTLSHQFSQSNARFKNSRANPYDVLTPVCLDSGRLPTSELPKCLAQLAVAGNETLPNGETHTWSCRRSRQLIREYDPAYETDEDDNEQGHNSLKRRMILASHLGITTSQLNEARRIHS